jgi:hypothetical protein
VSGRKPLEKFRAGQVSCAVWESQANVTCRQNEILRATLERKFKDSTGVEVDELLLSERDSARDPLPDQGVCGDGLGADSEGR